MNNELTVIAGFLERANCPEDVFGKIKGTSPADKVEQLGKAFRLLVKTAHPDMHKPEDKDLAEKVFGLITSIYDIAQERVRKNMYGLRLPLPGKEPTVVRGKYVTEGSWVGDIADIYSCHLESSTQIAPMLLKVARHPDDSDLIKSEAIVLRQLRSLLPSKSWANCIPKVIDSFMMDDKKRAAIVIENFADFYDGEEILTMLPEGVDSRDIAWMFKRLLVMMEWTYKLGYLHGAILPQHVMFSPDNDGRPRDDRKHSIRIVDWCYAIEYKKRTRLTAWVPEYEYFYPIEIKKKQQLGPYTDLYMGAKTMLHLMGCDMNTAGSHWIVSDKAERSIFEALKLCVEEDPSKRPQSIGRYFEYFNKVLLNTYGRPKWHEFNLPI